MNALPFYNLDGNPYCGDCHHIQIGINETHIHSNNCAKCEKPIHHNMLSAMKKYWHENCFVCTDCNRIFDKSCNNFFKFF
jgi:hypothetical protein